MEKPQHPEAECVYFLELDREEGSLHTTDQGGEVCGKQLDLGDVLGAVSVGEKFSGPTNIHGSGRQLWWRLSAFNVPTPT